MQIFKRMINKANPFTKLLYFSHTKHMTYQNINFIVINELGNWCLESFWEGACCNPCTDTHIQALLDSGMSPQ